MIEAVNYIDWMSPLLNSFILLKLLLLPAVAIYAYNQRRKTKRSGIPPHESEASRAPRPLWVNHTLHDSPPPKVPGDRTQE